MDWLTQVARARESKGLVEMGNITDLDKRPAVDLPDGGKSFLRSFSIEENGIEVLIPQVVGGRLLPQEEAIEHYRKTGEHLGKFKTPKDATEFGQALSKSLDKRLEK